MGGPRPATPGPCGQGWGWGFGVVRCGVVWCGGLCPGGCAPPPSARHVGWQGWGQACQAVFPWTLCWRPGGGQVPRRHGHATAVTLGGRRGPGMPTVCVWGFGPLPLPHAGPRPRVAEVGVRVGRGGASLDAVPAGSPPAIRAVIRERRRSPPHAGAKRGVEGAPTSRRC